MSVLDDYMVDPRLSLLDKTRIQAQVLVPLLQALRTELGRERADAITRNALHDWSKQLFATVGARVEGSPRRKWAAMHTALAEITEREVTAEMRRHDAHALEFDITQCRFASFFRALGEPELGALLVCATDFDIVAASGGEVSLTREETLMQGGPPLHLPLSIRAAIVNGRRLQSSQARLIATIEGRQAAIARNQVANSSEYAATLLSRRHDIGTEPRRNFDPAGQPAGKRHNKSARTPDLAEYSIMISRATGWRVPLVSPCLPLHSPPVPLLSVR